MNPKFSIEDQLRKIIEAYPARLDGYGIKINIAGAILEYTARSKLGIDQILQQDPKLYESLFPLNRISKDMEALFENLLYDYDIRRKTYKVAKKNKWQGLVELIKIIEKRWQIRNQPNEQSFLDRLAGHRVEGVLWQLSDLHFGKLHSIELKPDQLARRLSEIIDISAELSPRFVIISGDVSSSAKKNEFEKFEKFYMTLANALWKSKNLNRILCVPGNHETTFLPDGKADKLKAFRENIINKGIITPFIEYSKKQYQDNLGEMSVEVFKTPYNKRPPFVLVRDKKIDLRILLMVSSFYSGFVPEEVRKQLNSIGDGHVQKHLTKLLREDTGELEDEYISEIVNKIFPSEILNTTIAVVHHNLCPYGQIPCKTQNAKFLLSSLSKLNIRLVLHGHTHIVEDKTSNRIPDAREAYPIPCPTLSSFPHTHNVNGFMIHLIGPASEPRLITTLVWDVDQSNRFMFSKENPYIKYRFKVFNDRIELLKNTIHLA